MQYDAFSFQKNFDRNRSLICKFGYVSDIGSDMVDAKSQAIAEALRKWSDELDAEVDGKYIILLTPKVTFDSEEYISIRYDFTVTCGGVIVFHRRFAQNYIKKTANVILNRYVSGLRYKGEYYLTYDDKLYAVPIIGSMKSGARLARREEISLHCDGEKRAIKLLIPLFI